MFLALGASGLAKAAPLEARPRVRGVRISRPPVIDGRLDDPIWAAVPVSSAFTQKFPNEKQAPAEATQMRVAYDDEALYVAIDCEQTLAPVTSRLTRRDRLVEADWVAVAIDTRGDGKSGFDFNVNAAGVLSDGIRFDDTSLAGEWDENWEARTALGARGWSAEFRIPLRILRFPSTPVQSWGFQVRRYVSSRQETDEWAFIPRSSAGEVSLYGRLDELRDLRPGSSLELGPFAWGRYRHRDTQDPLLPRGGDFAAAIGLDLKWHPSQEVTFDAAVLPDFAQVEADQVILNLSTVETIYPEKRRFFLEGIETFQTPELQVLYTRRIGQTPAVPTLPAGSLLLEPPEPTTIYGAGKLTGHFGAAWELGALTAFTGANEVVTIDASGARTRQGVAPLSAYNVLRVKRALGDNGHVGLIATSLQRMEPTSSCPRDDTGARGSDGRCFNDAEVMSLDWRWRSPSGDYATTGQLTASRLRNGPSRLVPDGTVIAPGDIGTSARLVLSKDGGQYWLGTLWGAADSRELEVNDIGYLDRANQHGFGGKLTYRTLQPWAGTLETATTLETVVLDNADALATARSFELFSTAKLQSFWTLTAGLGYYLRHFEDREVGDGTTLERPAARAATLGLASDPRQRVSGRLRATAGWLEGGGRTVRAEAGLLFRALPALDLELLPQLFYGYGEPRYATTLDAGTHVFGPLRAQSADATLRATYTFTPRLSLQTYAQVFVAFRHYDALTAWPGAGGRGAVVRLAELAAQAPIGVEMNPDSQEGALNANVVLRWEFQIGCFLYGVYTRSQTPDVTLPPGTRAKLDLRSVRKAPAADAFMLKLAYWWG
jgi:hypothetical protein